MYKQILDDYYFVGRVNFKNLPDINQTTSKGDTEVVVTNKNLIVFTNTLATAVTNFILGRQYQAISLKGDGSTTISNNANIKTNTGADKLLSATKMYHFTLIDDIWYEDN